MACVLTLFITSVAAFTFDGRSSSAHMYIDRSKFSVGETGSVHFITRRDTSTLMLLQYLDVAGVAGHYIEVRLFSGRLQVFSTFSQSKSTCLYIMCRKDK